MMYTKEESEEIVRFLASALTDYIQSGVSVRSLTRTLADSIHCFFENNNAFLTKKGNVRWFNWGDLRKSGRRAALLEHFPHISKNAYEVLSTATPGDDILKTPKRLICDHVLPISALEKRLREVQVVTSDDTLSFLERSYRRCIITTEENIRLNTSGLSKDMPKNWDTGTCPFVRYDKVGIQRER